MSKLKNTTSTPVDSYLQVRTKTENTEDMKQVKDRFTQLVNHQYGSHLSQTVATDGGVDDPNMKTDTNN